MPRGLTERVEAWRDSGTSEDFRGHRIHVRRIEGSDPVLVMLHGFPSSSYDFSRLLPLTGDHAVLAFDFLGFGLSDKPHHHSYSLFEQADLAVQLSASRFAGRDVFVVAHDMGTSVATELMARELDGGAELAIRGALLFNGSIVIERASLTRAQKLLRSRLGGLAARLSNERLFRREFAALFSPARPLTDEEAADQWALICHNGGRTLGHELVSYLDERVRHAERWHGAIRDWPGSLSLAWGLQDPVATTAVLAALRDLRPAVPVHQMPDLGHYPQVEDPGRIAEALRAALAGAA
jgi:pimeloyl-ACP methyl ester carboxylesterase